jgi:twinkle protein
MHQQLIQKGIDLKGKVKGQIKTTCPECSQNRRNKSDLCLSVDIDNGVWNCHHCEWKGRVFEKPVKEYVKPLPRLEAVGAKISAWFDSRKISNDTLLRSKVTEATEWMPTKSTEVPVICFNYLREGETVNIKFRCQGKGFKMAQGAELIFYNLDALKGETECVIVEGEMDCLSFIESGVYNVVSVPNGASKGNQKLEYLDNCIEYFSGMTKIIIAVDADEAGYSLREELARRLGKERCFKVSYPEGCKDANEVLMAHGKASVKDLLSSAVEFPIEGILTMDDMIEDVVNYYDNGYPGGDKAGISNLDEYVSFMPGQITIITGIPGSGKSEIIDWISTKLSLNCNWAWAVCSFENQPASFHVTKLMEKFTGKSFAPRHNPLARIDDIQFDNAVNFVSQFYHFINISQVDVTMQGILDKAAELVSRKGIRGLIIDPWNYIEHKIPKGYTETQYTSESLSMVKGFAMKYGVHVFLVAHPTKLKKEPSGKYEIPTLYQISGSSHFFNKADNGLSVYRDFESNQVDVFIQKVRYSWLGKIGQASFHFNTETRQYISL